MINVVFSHANIIYSSFVTNKVCHTCFEGSNNASLLTFMSTIEPLNGSNYPKWRDSIEAALGLSDLDYALIVDRPVEPIIGG